MNTRRTLIRLPPPPSSPKPNSSHAYDNIANTISCMLWVPDIRPRTFVQGSLVSSFPLLMLKWTRQMMTTHQWILLTHDLLAYTILELSRIYVLIKCAQKEYTYILPYKYTVYHLKILQSIYSIQNRLQYRYNIMMEILIMNTKYSSIQEK